ncbi:MAG: TIGR02302 family protein [Bauldia sp.]|uniref:TIGR02302 family protein n=1 Tax=Bauldia sp. TaxID=2575872 RepID=UPI001D34E429|nr:TIGR02302 family protein [Bauldia sp.]MCB1497391.1 TIGR02302 family protein [Bauldia sp.]
MADSRGRDAEGGPDIPDIEENAVERETRARIERAITRARLVLLWESVWPVLAPLLVLGAFFVAVSWLGLWRVVSDPVRFVILGLFAIAAVYLAVHFFRLAKPARSAALARIEHATGLLHRPATALTDRLAVGNADPAAEALWAAHRTRLLASLDKVRAGIPSPGLARRDPWAIRFLAILLLAVGFVYAGPDRLAMIGEAFRGGEPVAATVARIDAWVTPPAYTGRPPIFLTGEAAKPSGSDYSVPTGSIVTVRTSGARDLSVVSSGQVGEVAAAAVEPDGADAAKGDDQPLERQVTLDTASEVTVRKGDREVMGWRFAVEPDHAPRIEFVRNPVPTRSGALSFTYSLKDDYGVVEARAEIAPVEASGGTGARPLFEAPVVPLSLPQLRTRDGIGETTRDLTSHPWAGARIRITLVARDEAGQEGRSAPLEITLPARRFSNPIARAVVEQRAALAMDANAAPGVGDVLDTLTMAPEDTYDSASIYLALRTAYFRVMRSRGDDDLRAVVDYLWTVALGIEDGDLSLAAQELRAAEEALRQALEDGASDEEIARLTEELRQAMQKFMQALAEQARRNPNMANMPPDPNTQTLRSQDLERMLDQIENLARNGARDAARQMLSELQNMLENLQTGQPMMGNQQQNGEMMQSLNELADMIRRQQELMDRTNRARQGLGENGEPMTAEEMAEALRRLQEQQQSLEQQLSDLMESLDGMGMQPGEGDPLGQAGKSMGRAAGDLGDGRPGSALGNQGEALEALRQGAEGMARQLANNQGPGMNGNPNGHQMPNEDPLGRPQRNVGPDLGTTVKVPDEIDIQRAREILEAIRERLGDATRPVIERDYLERLLDQF